MRLFKNQIQITVVFYLFCVFAHAERILYVAGPGDGSWSRNEALLLYESLSQHAPQEDTRNVGDGEKALQLPQISSALTELSHTGERLLVIVLAFVEDKQGSPALLFGPGNWVPIEELFQTVLSVVGDQPVDFFFDIYGSPISLDTSFLGGGSRVVMAGCNRSFFSTDGKFGSALRDKEEGSFLLNLENLLLFYLTHLDFRRLPSLFFGSDDMFSLESLLRKRIGRKFSGSERERIHRRLDGIFESSQVETIIRYLEESIAMGKMNERLWGRASAVVLAAEEESQGSGSCGETLHLP